MKKIKKSKKFVVILLILSILAISCAAVSAAEVNDGITDVQSDIINSDDTVIVDDIEVATQTEASPTRAVNNDSSPESILGAAIDGEQLGTTYENAYGWQLGPMYESDKNYSENHVFELKDSQGRVYSPETTNVIVTKIWDDDSNRDGMRPTRITLVLTGTDGTVYISNNNATIIQSGGDIWKYNFTVYKYYNGEEVSFTVSEPEEPENYTASYDQDSLTVTNTHVPETINVTATKIWDDDNNRDGLRTEDIAIRLIGDGDNVYTDATLTKDGNIWTYTFTNVHKYKNGEEIDYTAGERVPDGYIPYINGLTITNTHVPETKNITVTKIWDDADNLERVRPESIDVTLYGGDQSNSTTMSGEGNRWTYVFKNMPVYYDEGKKIVYNVLETVVPDMYEAAYDQEALIITNTHDLVCDVVVTVTVNKPEVFIGEVVEYIITVTNVGPVDASGIYVTSTILPEGLTYITDNLTDNQYNEKRANLLSSILRGDTPGYDQSTGIWTIGDLAVGEEVKLAILARADVLGEHVISEEVTADSDINPDNNKDSTTVNVIPFSDLSIEKTVDKTKINVGDTVTYTFTVTNNGPINATGVKMTDKNILNHEFVSASSEDYDPSTGVWTIGDLANGESVTLTVTVKINEAGSFTNTATVSGDQDDNDTSNNNASAKVTVSEVPPDEQPDDQPDEQPDEPTMTPKEAGELPKTGNPLFVLIISLMVLTGAMFVRKE